MNIDKYLYEIIEEYKESNSNEEKAEIFNNFCSSLWGCKNKRRIFTKKVKFKIKKELLETDIGTIFNNYSEIEYKTYKSTSKDDDWCMLIRQKINNLYTNYFDKNVILNKDYINLLNKPKSMYYQWLNGKVYNADELVDIINKNFNDANNLKLKYQKQKMELSWSGYKKLIEEFLQKIFNNCKLVSEYENEFGAPNIFLYESIEDNFYTKYICKSLDLYMRNYQKKVNGLYVPSSRQHKKYIYCKECGKLIEKTGNKKMYCKECALKKRKESNKKSDIKYRNNKRENRN